MNIGSNVIIDSDAVADGNLTDDRGIVLELWNEPLKNSEPTPLAKILLNNGEIGVVGQHEINEYNNFKYK